MKFSTRITMFVTLALVEATTALMGRYANDTTVVVPTLAGTGYSNIETMPTVQPTNSTNATVSVTSSSVFQLTTTVVDSTTLSYTLGPEGSSSVVTTVIENTSTITMTTTMYITRTITRPNGPQLSSVNNNPTATAEPTVTVTNYLTATKTITLQNVQPGTIGSAAPHDDSNSTPDSSSGADGDTDDTSDTSTSVGSGAGSFFQFGNSGSDAVYSTTSPGNLFGGHHGACGVTTITSTIIEKSTVTVTPTSTDKFPIDPTASPTYGYSNGTNPTAGFPTASSGFLTFIRRPQPTKM